MAGCDMRRRPPSYGDFERRPFPAPPLGMAYVPMQYWNQTNDMKKALQAGTLFPELDKPFIGRRACR